MDHVVHFEMPAEDKKRISTFYATVFGWKTQQLGPEMGEYVLVQTGETDDKGMPQKPGFINGGFYQKGEGGGAVPHLVISVENLDKHMGKVKSGGGEIQGEPMDIPGVGKFVMFTDTEGNRVGMLQPAQM
jgi:predicted enzyme related to lactoylglutathione lyase